MILAFNIGNTNFSIGAIKGESVKESRNFSYKYLVEELTDEHNFIDCIISCLERESIQSKNITGTIISSVNPKLTGYLENAIAELFEIKPIIISPEMNMALDLSEYDTTLIGSDRVAICEGALNKYDTPIIIFDFGTATTINVIDSSGRFMGGAILPGLVMGFNALNKETAQLPPITNITTSDGNHQDDNILLIGRNTEECIISGAIFGNAAMLDGMVLRIQESLLELEESTDSKATTTTKKKSIPTYISGTTTDSILAAIAPNYDSEISNDITILATGGNAEYILPHCETDVIYAPNLLMDGLNELYKRNYEKNS